MFTIDLANTIFILCVAIGGVLLLLTVLLDDILGGALDFLHIDFDLGGVTLMPLLLGFVSMFGVGGLFGTEVFNLDAGPASLVGIAFGLVGAGVVSLLFSFLRRAESPTAFSLGDLVGRHGRVSVTIPAGRSGSVLLSYAGGTDNMTATADADIAAGTVVVVTAIYGSTLVVTPASASATQGGSVDA